VWAKGIGKEYQGCLIRQIEFGIHQMLNKMQKNDEGFEINLAIVHLDRSAEEFEHVGHHGDILSLKE
jgi:hypothetical protein